MTGELKTSQARCAKSYQGDFCGVWGNNDDPIQAFPYLKSTKKACEAKYEALLLVLKTGKLINSSHGD